MCRRVPGKGLCCCGKSLAKNKLEERGSFDLQVIISHQRKPEKDLKEGSDLEAGTETMTMEKAAY